jgi:hypothetical protein
MESVAKETLFLVKMSRITAAERTIDVVNLDCVVPLDLQKKRSVHNQQIICCPASAVT